MFSYCSSCCEEVETDLSHGGKERKTAAESKIKHVCRMMVLKSRGLDPISKKRKRPSWVPLRDRSVKKGAPPPPDSERELKHRLSSKLKDCILHTDGAQANRKVHRTSPQLKGQVHVAVNHSALQCSHFAKVNFKDVYKEACQGCKEKGFFIQKSSQIESVYKFS